MIVDLFLLIEAKYMNCSMISVSQLHYCPLLVGLSCKFDALLKGGGRGEETSKMQPSFVNNFYRTGKRA